MLGTASAEKTLIDARYYIFTCFCLYLEHVATGIPSSSLFGNQARVWLRMVLMSPLVAES